MNRKRYFIRILALTAAVLLLGACILQPESEKTGTVAITFASVGGSSTEIGASVVPRGTTHARVWLYLDGRELRTATVSLGETGGSVRFEEIPEGGGYSLVAVLGKMASGVFQPLGYAQTTETFSVSGGRETALAAAAKEITNNFSLEGINLNSVVRVGSDVFAATSSAVYRNSTNVGSGTIAGVSVGRRPDGTPTAFLNRNDGIRYWNGSSFVAITPDPDDPVGNIQNSGAFVVEDEFSVDDPELVIYYSRLGGLGGVTTPTGPTPVWDWGDSGDDMSDVVASDENPIRAMATDEDNAAYFAGVLGTFKMTKEFFDEDDIDVGALLGGDDSDTSGLTFFGVAYPGTSRPMRIATMGLIRAANISGSNNRVVVGTGRGAFFFGGNAIDDLTSTGLIKAGNVTQITVPGIRDQAVVDISVAGNRIAIATRETIVVVDANNPNTVIARVPTRAVVLGRLNDVFLHRVGTTETRVYVAGDQGLTVWSVD